MINIMRGLNIKFYQFHCTSIHNMAISFTATPFMSILGFLLCHPTAFLSIPPVGLLLWTYRKVKVTIPVMKIIFVYYNLTKLLASLLMIAYRQIYDQMIISCFSLQKCIHGKYLENAKVQICILVVHLLTSHKQFFLLNKLPSRLLYFFVLTKRDQIYEFCTSERFCHVQSILLSSDSATLQSPLKTIGNTVILWGLRSVK